jgi:hypothetical protein
MRSTFRFAAQQALDDASTSWQLVYNMPSGWHWIRLDDNGRNIGQSAGGYLTRHECVTNAKEHGAPEDFA